MFIAIAELVFVGADFLIGQRLHSFYRYFRSLVYQIWWLQVNLVVNCASLHVASKNTFPFIYLVWRSCSNSFQRKKSSKWYHKRTLTLTTLKHNFITKMCAGKNKINIIIYIIVKCNKSNSWCVRVCSIFANKFLRIAQIHIWISIQSSWAATERERKMNEESLIACNLSGC